MAKDNSSSTSIVTSSGSRGTLGVANDHIRPVDYTDRRWGRQEISPEQTYLDRTWGGFSEVDHPRNIYWDYYYSGQDVRIFVDGTEDDTEFSDLPIVEFAWNIEQQKQPVYGFWSHTYDAVMRGTRIVSGAFSLVTRYPNYMTNVLRKAAEARARNDSSYQYFRNLTEDDEKIAKYWGKTMDPVVESQGRHLFSIHPPFSLVVVYGIQSVSMNSYLTYPNAMDADMQRSNALYQDVNERLIDPEELDQTNYVVLEACELVQCQRAIGSDGSVLVETYQFFARDMVSPVQSNDRIRRAPATSGQNTPGSGASLPKITLDPLPRINL